MTNDGWGSKWPSGAGWFDKPKQAEAPRQRSQWDKDIASLDWPKAPSLTAWDIATGDRTMLTTFENDGIKHKIISQTELKSQGSNLVDNEQYLYFQCNDCGNILDPHTKSFAKLQEHRVNASWKCVWNIDGMGYKVYCAKCGEKV